MASSPPTLRIPPPAPERLGTRDLGSAAMTTTHASAEVTAAVSPSRDVIFQILSWLPAKWLGRCRCVSKEWRALISDRSFVAAHTSRAEPLLVAMSGSMWNTALLLLDTDGAVVRVVKDQGETQSLGAHWTLRASHDGLACISSGYDDSGTLVADLATGKTLLACFKPVKETGYLCFGFGRATQSGSIKVFRLVVPRRGVHTRTCEVLTLGGEGARWRQAKPPPTMLSHTSGVAVNGALHFLSQDKCDVLSFDLDTEKWKLIHGPQGGVDAITIAHLNGALCMAQRMHHVINIWLLINDSDKNIWIKAYTMPAPLFAFHMPLRLLRPVREMLFCGYDYTGNLVLQVYHPRLGRCTQVKTQANLSGKIGLCCSSLDPRFCGQSDPR